MTQPEFKQQFKEDDKITLEHWNPHEYLKILYIGKMKIFAEDEKGNEMDWDIDEDWVLFKPLK